MDAGRADTRRTGFDHVLRQIALQSRPVAAFRLVYRDEYVQGRRFRLQFFELSPEDKIRRRLAGEEERYVPLPGGRGQVTDDAHHGRDADAPPMRTIELASA